MKSNSYDEVLSGLDSTAAAQRPLTSGAIYMQANEREATLLARGLGCRVLHVARIGVECRVHVELPDWRAVNSVTTAAIYAGMRYESANPAAGAAQGARP